MTTRRTGELPNGQTSGADEEIELPETGPGRFQLGGEFPAPQKGANIARRKSALGRGLSALLSSSAVPVDLSNIPLAGVGGSALARPQAESSEGAESRAANPAAPSGASSGAPSPTGIPDSAESQNRQENQGSQEHLGRPDNPSARRVSPSLDPKTGAGLTAPASTASHLSIVPDRIEPDRIVPNGAVSDRFSPGSGGTESDPATTFNTAPASPARARGESASDDLAPKDATPSAGSRHMGPSLAAETDTVREEELPEGSLVYLSIDRVTPNLDQPRKHFDAGELQELAETIRKTGLLQPLVVRRKGSESGQLAAYEIVAGERRYRAAKLAGLVKIPAILKQLDDQEALEIGIIENVQRANLNPIEEALAYQRLIHFFGSTQAEVAEKVGKDRASVANLLRLLKLDTEVQELIAEGALSAGHGRALLMCSTPAAQKELAARILEEGLSVRAAEAVVSGKDAAAEAASPGTPEASAPNVSPQRNRESAARGPKPPHIISLEERLRRELGTKVSLSVNDAGSGELRIAFFSLEELEGLVERIESVPE